MIRMKGQSGHVTVFFGKNGSTELENFGIRENMDVLHIIMFSKFAFTPRGALHTPALSCNCKKVLPSDIKLL